MTIEYTTVWGQTVTEKVSKKKAEKRMNELRTLPDVKSDSVRVVFS